MRAGGASRGGSKRLRRQRTSRGGSASFSIGKPMVSERCGRTILTTFAWKGQRANGPVGFANRS